MNALERNLGEPPDGASPPRTSHPAFLAGPERLALLVYAACLVLVLVLYHFQ